MRTHHNPLSVGINSPIDFDMAATRGKKRALYGSIDKAVSDFYNRHPYPPPVRNLDRYQKRWQVQSRQRADFHLYWPLESFHERGSILVAGCGTSQAAKYALRYPETRIVGIDNSETSIQHSQDLRKKYGLENLELLVLPIERASELGEGFDQIICTGVLHHLPDPEIGLNILRRVLSPNGAMHLMVYAPYGRTGIYMLQNFCHRIGVLPNSREIEDLAQTLQFLPNDHPLHQRLRDSLDFQSEAGLADALLHPQDRAYSVPQVLEFIQRCGLTFGRWLRQAPYLPQCNPIAKSPYASRISQLPHFQQYAIMELFRGTMTRHSLIVYRDDQPTHKFALRFDKDGWQEYIPIRMPSTISIQERLPVGAAAVLINQAHTFTDLYLPIDQLEKQWFDAIDGQRSTAEILKESNSNSELELQSKARDFFEQLWHYDQVVFNASKRGASDSSIKCVL